MRNLIPLIALSLVVSIAGCDFDEGKQESGDPVILVGAHMSKEDFVAQAAGVVSSDDIYCDGSGPCTFLKTEDVDVDFLLGGRRFRFKGAKYWGGQFDGGGIVRFSADSPLLAIGEVMKRAESSARQLNASSKLGVEKDSRLFSIERQLAFGSYRAARDALLRKAPDDITGIMIGEWHFDNQLLFLSVIHKRPDGGPRMVGDSPPEAPLEEVAYQLRLSIAPVEER